MKCVNCTETAISVFQAPGVTDQPYCERHLPAAYQNTEWVLPAPDETLQARTAVASEEPLAEVVPVEEDPNPELKPTPKTARRTRKTPGER